MSRNKHLRDDILEDYHDFEEGEDCCSDGNLVDVIGSLIKARDFYRLQNALDRGAYINFTNKFGEGPLHLAVSQDETLEGVRIVELLLYVGCGVTGQDRFGQTPLHLAAKHAPMYTLKLLEAAAPVNTQDNAGRTALMLACNCGKETALQVVQMLLDRSAIVNIRDQENQTALHYLCGRMGGSDVTVKMEIAYKLLYAGLDVNIRDHSGISAAKMLFRNGQGINLQNVNTDPYLALLRVLARGGSDFQQEYDSVLMGRDHGFPSWETLRWPTHSVQTLYALGSLAQQRFCGETGPTARGTSSRRQEIPGQLSRRRPSQRFDRNQLMSRQMSVANSPGGVSQRFSTRRRPEQERLPNLPQMHRLDDSISQGSTGFERDFRFNNRDIGTHSGQPNWASGQRQTGMGSWGFSGTSFPPASQASGFPGTSQTFSSGTEGQTFLGEATSPVLGVRESFTRSGDPSSRNSFFRSDQSVTRPRDSPEGQRRSTFRSRNDFQNNDPFSRPEDALTDQLGPMPGDPIPPLADKNPAFQPPANSLTFPGLPQSFSRSLGSFPSSATTGSFPSSPQQFSGSSMSLPEPSTSFSSSPQSFPSLSQSFTGSSQSFPGSSESLPVSTQSFPGSSQSFPRTSQSFPGSSQSFTGLSQSFPGSSQSFPGSSRSFPGSSQSFPDSSQSFPGSSQSFPGLSHHFLNHLSHSLVHLNHSLIHLSHSPIHLSYSLEHLSHSL
ncbi:YL093-like protein, partial [Mya arenaria]